METDDAPLWAQLGQTPHGPARLKLFELYLPFARMIASRIRKERAGADLDMGDMRQNAAVGLMQAIDRFDPTQGVSFKAYASRRIAGAVIDGIAESNELRRQASFKQRQRTERVRSILGRRPDAPQTPEAALEALTELAIELAVGLIAETLLPSDEAEVETAIPDAYESIAWQQMVRRIADAVSTLPERDRSVIELHYKAGLEFARIAETLNLSRGRISQIHAAALRRLREQLPGRDHVHFQG